MKGCQSIRWKRYLRQDGRRGIRNKPLVVCTVECSSHVAKEIARCIDSSDVDVVGFDGCCDNEYAVRPLLALIRHPDAGGVLAVGLGCEYTQLRHLAERAPETEEPTQWFFMQEHGGTESSTEHGLQQAHLLLEELRQTPVVPISFSNLVVGAECSGSDYTSGLAGNVVVGCFYDELVDLGGAAALEEVVEAVSLKDLLVQRTADDCAREQPAYTYNKALEHYKSVCQYSVSPGSLAGGLSSIEEKGMGTVVKSGNRPISGVAKVSQQLPKNGLWLLDNIPDPHWMGFGCTNPNDNGELMDPISCGYQLVFLVTGRGNTVDSAMASVYRITGNSGAFHRMSGDMGFDIGPVLSGEVTLEQLCQDLYGEVIRVCLGEPTNAERLGRKERFAPCKYQEKEVVVRRKCE